MTDRFALFGNPIAHSRSPEIYTAFARQFGFDLDYAKIEPAEDAFADAFAAFRATGGRGGNVTAPFKLAAYETATIRNPRAELAGAVNCFQFVGDDVIVENFDGQGLVADIERNLGFAIKGREVLLLGGGGATRGALFPLLESRPGRLVLCDRPPDNANVLAKRFARFGTIEPLPYEALQGQSFDIVINATSASLRGECPSIPATVFRSGALAYELVYGKGLTPFLALAKSGDAVLADGVGMLVEQAAEAFNWWYNKRPQTDAMIEKLKGRS